MIYASNNGNLQIESTDFAGGRINLVQTGSMAFGINNTGSTLTQDIHYFHTDHLGSVRAITNQGGQWLNKTPTIHLAADTPLATPTPKQPTDSSSTAKKNRQPAI